MQCRLFTLLGVSSVAVILTNLIIGCERTPIERPTQARRICSLNLTSDEILSELVSVERVIAVTQYADKREVSNVFGVYPQEVRRVEHADMEILLQLSPDLVILSTFHNADFLSVMDRTSLPHFQMPQILSSEDIIDTYLEIGRRVGEERKAQQMATMIRGQLTILDRHLKDLDTRPKVFYVSAQYTAGTKTLVDELIRRSGGRNIAAELGIEGFDLFERERVLLQEPDFILSVDSKDEAALTEGEISEPEIHNLFPGAKVIGLPGKWLSSNSRYWVRGVEKLARILHPSRFGS